MKRLPIRNSNGSGLLVVMVLTALISFIGVGLNRMADRAEKNAFRSLATKVVKDGNNFTAELIHQLLESGTIKGYKTADLSNPPPTYWQAVPKSGVNWTFTDGYMDTDTKSPKAEMQVSYCNFKKLTTQDLLTMYSQNPTLPNCEIVTEKVRFVNAISGQYLEFRSVIDMPITTR